MTTRSIALMLAIALAAAGGIWSYVNSGSAASGPSDETSSSDEDHQAGQEEPSDTDPQANGGAVRVSPSLKVGGRDWPLVVEDDPKANEELTAVLSDLQLVVQRLTKMRRTEPNPDRVFQIGGSVRQPVAFVDFSSDDTFYLPRILREHLGYIVSQEEKEYLVIPKDIVDAYRSAPKLNKLTFPSRDSLAAFVKFVNDLTPKSVDDLSDEKVKSLFFLNTALYQNLSAADLRKNLKVIANHRLRMPSLLDNVKLDLRAPATRCYSTIMIEDANPSYCEKVYLGYLQSQWNIVL